MYIPSIKFKEGVPVAIVYAVSSSIVHVLRAHGEKIDGSFIGDDHKASIIAIGRYIATNVNYLLPLYKQLVAPITAESICTGLTFGEAHELTKLGHSIARDGWNGRGIFVARQVPDANSKMTSPYLYINTTGLQTDNALAPKCCTPWLPSQTDLEASDWKVVFQQPEKMKEAQ